MERGERDQGSSGATTSGVAPRRAVVVAAMDDAVAGGDDLDAPGCGGIQFEDELERVAVLAVLVGADGHGAALR